MSCRLEVLGRVFADGTIAAAHVAADETHPEVHPRLANFQALLTPGGGQRLNVGVDLVEMGAFTHEPDYDVCVLLVSKLYLGALGRWVFKVSGGDFRMVRSLMVDWPRERGDY